MTSTNLEREEGQPCYAVGQRVRLLSSIWDDGADHHPPCYLAHKGEVLIVRKRGGGIFPVYVSHEDITDRSFGVNLDEIELAATGESNA